jgi:predicted RNA-binding Zn-ribbon protein involved in translation (DUF1610 family)/TM2 domain-containing membrane protein YozV
MIGASQTTEIKCPSCGQLLEVDSELLSEPFECPSCKHRLAIRGAIRPPPPLPTVQVCPYCKEEIKAFAGKCRHCGEYLSSDLRKAATHPARNRGVFIMLGIATGWLGFHNFYIGRYAIGALQAASSILTVGTIGIGVPCIVAIWAIIEICVITNDASERKLI